VAISTCLGLSKDGTDELEVEGRPTLDRGIEDGKTVLADC
jgi:hypothetical protein